jgi:hypothetical protein
MTALLMAALLGGVPIGGTLYVKGAQVKLHSQPSLKSSGSLLKRGEPVVWLGATKKDPAVHEITAHGKHGFVAMTDLTPFAPEAGGPEAFHAVEKFHVTGYVKCRLSDSPSGLPATPVEEQLDALSTSSMEEVPNAQRLRQEKR